MNQATSVKHGQLPIVKGELEVCVYECVFKKHKEKQKTGALVQPELYIMTTIEYISTYKSSTKKALGLERVCSLKNHISNI